MKRRSLILMILIVLLPVGLLTWLAIRMAKDEQSVTQQRFRSVMEQRLKDLNRVIAGRFSETERQLKQITAVDDFELSALRKRVRTEPQVTQLFVLTPSGSLLYPNPGNVLNGTEQTFLHRAARMFTDRDLQNAVALMEAGAQGDFSPALPAITAPANPESQQEQFAQLSTARSLKAEPSAAQQQPQLPSRRSPDGPKAGIEIEGNQLAGNQPAEDQSADRKPSGSRQTPPLSDNSGSPELSDLPSGENPPDEAVPEQLGQAVPPTARELISSGQAMPQATDPFLPSSGWFVWYWDRGLNLIYWQRRPSGHIVGAALERARWIADLIAWLPETDTSESPGSSKVDTSFRVVSSAAELVYEWGEQVPERAVPFCEAPMSVPLASWRLQCFVPERQIAAGGGRSAMLGFGAGMIGFVLTLVAMAWLLFRDYSRDMREASQQVSFVNQVSHELKTPLTNIRLYAELLERDLEQVATELSEKPRRRLEIISSEAQRLGRLIGNVLTFAKQHRKTLQVQPAQVDVTGLVQHIADRFTPSLNDHGIEVSLSENGGGLLWLDPDFVEQILGNLISNVEKYAASGKQLQIRVAATGDQAIIDVIDAGPGIGASQKASLFVPFSRLSNDLRASTGTGIGLSISRELARLHGGDVTLMDSTVGCWFQVSLKSQKLTMPSEDLRNTGNA